MFDRPILWYRNGIYLSLLIEGLLFLLGDGRGGYFEVTTGRRAYWKKFLVQKLFNSYQLFALTKHRFSRRSKVKVFMGKPRCPKPSKCLDTNMTEPYSTVYYAVVCELYR